MRSIGDRWHGVCYRLLLLAGFRYYTARAAMPSQVRYMKEIRTSKKELLLLQLLAAVEAFCRDLLGEAIIKADTQLSVV